MCFLDVGQVDPEGMHQTYQGKMVYDNQHQYWQGYVPDGSSDPTT